MRPARQLAVPACRAGMMAACVTLGLAAAQPARAQLAVGLRVTPTATVAPALVTLTATVAGDEPIVEYAWRGLDAWPRCARARCPLALPLAGCRRVAVQMTARSGQTAEAEAQVCAGDGAGRPPQARLDLQPVGEGLRVRQDAQAGDAPIVARHLFVDGARIDAPFAFLESREGCHALELSVVDAAGRTGVDARTVCLDEVSPRPWLGADPGPVTTAAQQRVCTSFTHPLGYEVQAVGSDDVPALGCGPVEPVPRVARRRVLVLEDSAGQRSVASLFVAQAPASGPPTLPWLSEARPALGASVVFEVAGGAPPFEVSAALERGAERVQDAVVVRQGERTFEVEVPRPVVVQEELHLALEVRDARGLGTTHRLPAQDPSASPDAGVLDGGIGVPSFDGGCASLGREGGAPLLVLLAGLGLRPRRRRCS